jgi:hypothetical protein
LKNKVPVKAKEDFMNTQFDENKTKAFEAEGDVTFWLPDASAAVVWRVLWRGTTISQVMFTNISSMIQQHPFRLV